MYALDFSLNNISMMALILSVGFVVDDAIVMLENCVRHVERGETPLQAAVRGSREIWFTILSMTISLAAVFIPLLFMGGILGRLFREFAVTICVAVLISGFVSISLTPMLCSRVLRPLREREHRNAIANAIERVFQSTQNIYGVTLRWTLRRRAWMMLVFAAVLGLTAWAYVAVPKGFIPQTDNDQLMVSTEVAQGTSYPAMSEFQERLARVLQTDPDVEAFFSSVGGSGFGGGRGGSNNGRIFVTLKPRSERNATAEEIANRLRPRLLGFPGIRAVISLPTAIRIGGRGSRASFEFTLQADDTELLYREAAKLQQEVAKLPIVQEVNSDLEIALRG